MTMGFPSFGFGGSNNGAIDEKTTQQVQETQKKYVHLQVDNALDLIAFLGKDIKTLNIPEEAIKYVGTHPFAVYYDTSFLGKPCDNVMLGFTNDFATKTDKVDNVYITCKNTKFWDCKAYLDSQLGECHDSGIMPYAAVNGGAVTYLTYYKDGVKYYLSMGSANDFYRLVLSLGVPKNPPNHQSLGILNMTGSMSTGMNFSTNTMASVQTANNRETWFCPNCGSRSFGKFCGECGTKKPEQVVK